MRKAFAESILELAEKDEKLVVLIGDISHHLLKKFEEKYPNRFYNIGICEQSMIGVAAGLAIEGYRPIVHTIAPFCVERAYEQIKIDLCYQNLDVTIISVGSSFDYAHLGCTHHCYSDVSILRPLPNIDIYVPGTSDEYKKIFNDSWSNGNAKYFKLSITEHKQNFEVSPGECNVLNLGNEGTIFVNGHLLEEVLKIENCKNYSIIYCPTIEPLSQNCKKVMCEVIKSNPNILVVEENSTSGGFGDKISEIAFEAKLSIKMRKLGIPRKFCLNYGSADDHRADLGLISKNMKKILNEFKNV